MILRQEAVLPPRLLGVFLQIHERFPLDKPILYGEKVKTIGPGIRANSLASRYDRSFKIKKMMMYHASLPEEEVAKWN